MTYDLQFKSMAVECCARFHLEMGDSHRFTDFARSSLAPLDTGYMVANQDMKSEVL